MDIHQLRTFLAVLEHASFSGAAEAIHLTQSTVSFHIKSLETEVGTRLIDRRRGKARPTAAGRTLQEYAGKIVSLRGEAMARMQSEQRGEVGTVTVSASTIPGEYLLPPFLASFNRLHPKVQIDLRISDSQQALQELLGEKCDVALLGSRPPAARVTSEPFAPDDLILVAPAPNPFTPWPRVTHAELMHVPLILRETGSGTQRATLEFFRKAHLDPGRFTHALRVGSTQAARQSVIAGAGMTFISRCAVETDLRAGVLTRIACPRTPIRRHIFLARLKNATLSLPARALIDFLRSHIR
ncbi:MAG: LysR family transcriptional regulator [Nitrospirae bacterium]|nr:LysR family transcriptional regulator [Nitrospirota bacterium]